MARRKNEKPDRAKTQKDPELQAIYDRVRREFSAADLQKYTEIEEGIPVEKVIAEMEEIHRKMMSKKKRKP